MTRRVEHGQDVIDAILEVEGYYKAPDIGTEGLALEIAKSVRELPKTAFDKEGWCYLGGTTIIKDARTGVCLCTIRTKELEFIAGGSEKCAYFYGIKGSALLGKQVAAIRKTIELIKYYKNFLESDQ